MHALQELFLIKNISHTSKRTSTHLSQVEPLWWWTTIRQQKRFLEAEPCLFLCKKWRISVASARRIYKDRKISWGVTSQCCVRLNTCPTFAQNYFHENRCIPNEKKCQKWSAEFSLLYCLHYNFWLNMERCRITVAIKGIPEFNVTTE